jgi:hypothetical protein
MSDTQNINILISNVFNQSNMSLVVIFLAIYFVLYYGMGVYFGGSENPTGSQLAISRMIDVLIIGVFIFLLLWYYLSLSVYDKNHLFAYLLQWTKDFFNSSQTLIELVISIIVFYALVYLCRVPMTDDTKPVSISFIENKLWILLAIQVILVGFIFFFNIHIIDILLSTSLIDWFNNVPEIVDISNNKQSYDVSGNTKSYDASGNKPPTQIDEVFNISNNMYTYDDAQAICKSYDAKLATYDQVEDSYNNGGEWCNYGWSSDQMALFPTQKNTWDNLQKTDKNKNDCGRPGINGGYISNPYIKFGVNCYGKKPKATAAELAQMAANNNKSYPATIKDQVLDAKVQFWKDNSARMLNINSFNKNKWTEY